MKKYLIYSKKKLYFINSKEDCSEAKTTTATIIMIIIVITIILIHCQQSQFQRTPIRHNIKTTDR